MSTLTDKLVDFDILIENEPRREVSAKAGQISEHTSALEESIFRLNGMLMSIKRLQKQSVLSLSLFLKFDEIFQSSYARESGFLSRQINTKVGRLFLPLTFLTFSQSSFLVRRFRDVLCYWHGSVRSLFLIC